MVNFFDFLEVQRAFAGSYDHQCAFDGNQFEVDTQGKNILPRKQKNNNMEPKSAGLENDFLLQGAIFELHVSLGGGVSYDLREQDRNIYLLYTVHSRKLAYTQFQENLGL